MLDTSKLIFEYLNKGKKIKEGKTLKAQIEQENQVKDSRPPWRSTGVSSMPSWNKPSKYQMNCNVKAKVYTGLDAGSQANSVIKEESLTQQEDSNVNQNQNDEDEPFSQNTLENDSLFFRGSNQHHLLAQEYQKHIIGGHYLYMEAQDLSS